MTTDYGFIISDDEAHSERMEADMQQAQFEAEGRAYGRRMAKMLKLYRAGSLAEAAALCTHGWTYPLASLAASNNADPRTGQDGFRCLDCGSVISERGEYAEVLIPCDIAPNEAC